jgi:chromosome segregation ATPase
MSKTETKSNNENPIYDETVQKLLVEVDKRDEIIEKLKNEIVSREQVFKDISKMKNEIDSYTGKISLLYNEIKARDKIIEELKSNNPNLNQLNDLENNESNYYKSKYEEEKIKNDKLRNSISDVTVMIKQLNDSKDQMKNAYENTIKELMNTINKNKLESGNDNEINDELLKQNVELKKMNEFLISKLESLPDLEKKFQELFEMINILKKENETLKQKLNSKNL